MATIKSFTSLEQSRKLAEILPLESADMNWTPCDNGKMEYYKAENERIVTAFEKKYHIPCWSLAALLGVLPEIQGGKPAISLNDNYITYPRISDLHTEAGNLVDACYELILKLHELNLL